MSDRRQTSIGLPGHPKSANNDAFLDSLAVNEGPREILAPFFLKVVDALSDRGLRLSFEPLSTLVRTNEANKDTWRPLIPLFDPAHGIDDDKAFAVVGRNEDGDVVATQAARFYDWPDTSFQEEATSLRLFYRDPSRSKRPAESCGVTCENARTVSGRVVFSGGGWYRRDYRKQWISGLLPRLSRALALTRWSQDFTISIMAESVVDGGMARRCGYTNVDYAVNLAGGPVGDVRCALVWMGRRQLLDDLAAFNATPLDELMAGEDIRAA